LAQLGVERGLSANTLAAYRRDLTRYLAYLTIHGIEDPRTITPDLIAAYQRTLSVGDDEHQPLATPSVARAVVAVRNLHAFMAQEGLSDGNEASDVVVPKIGKRLPKALSIWSVQTLIDSVERVSPIGLRDVALLELLYGTGMRISEAVGLQVADVTPLLADYAHNSDHMGPADDSAHIHHVDDADRPHHADQANDADHDEHPDTRALGLRIIGKGDKERVVPVGSYARVALSEYLTNGRPQLATEAEDDAHAPLFVNTRGRRLSRQLAWTIINSRAEAAGIADDISPHSLRHSFATHLLDGGADVRVVQELLGHASVTTTQIYTEVTIQHLREVYVTAHPRAR
jgi:integrase/recombinase XerD